MTINENADVIRVFDTEANLIAGSRIRPGMLAFATDTHRMVRKKLSDSSFAYWSDDTKQMLLAGNQTATGNKTWNGTSIFNAASTFNAAVTLVSVGIDIGAQQTFNSTSKSDLGTGGTNLAPTSDSITGIARVVINPTTPNVDDHYLFTDETDGQVVYVYNKSGSQDANVEGFVVPHDRMSIFMYDTTEGWMVCESA